MANPSQYKINASSFYNLSKCHRRIYLDLYGNPDEKGEHSDFMQLLWEKGVRIEREIIEKISKGKEMIAVEGVAGKDTFEKTLNLMKSRVSLIYQGVLIADDRIGRPDLLERVEGASTFGNYYYVPCDIKSGRATEDKDSLDIKTHYANQVIFYTELLEKIQGLKPPIGKIIDIGGVETSFSIAEYDTDYQENKTILSSIVYEKNEPEPLIGGTCKDCVWAASCLKIANTRQDPTLLFKLGKQKYDLRERGINNIQDLSRIDIHELLTPQKKIKGVAEKKLTQWKRRANVWITNKPIVHTKPQLKEAKREIYYDIEDDPSIDHVYLHGFIAIENGKKGGYRSILATERKDEEKAAKELWAYIGSLSENDVIYHYGSYEKTKANRLKEKYNLPDAMLEKFDRLRVDLYRIVESSSDWPVSSYGIKPIAKYLGFKWTSEDASGANSIAWYNDYQKDPEHNKKLLDKILTYNQEDCEAMIVVKKWLESK